MIAKINRYTMIVVLFAFLSCKKEASDSDVIFSQTCDFSGSKVEIVNNLSGTLSYTNNVQHLPPSEVPPSEYTFLIQSPGLLQMIVCNMPVDFEMEEGASRNVTFGGRILILPDEVDASNTHIELNNLKLK